MPKKDGPNCLLCRHFFLTWKLDRPRACRAYGFESSEFPSVVVERESGTPCTLFEPKHQ